MGVRRNLTVVWTMPNYYDFKEAKIGSFALTTPSTRYVKVQDAYTFNGITETVGYHYRTFIESRGYRFPRKGAPDYPIAYPYYARVGMLPNACYIDIRRAFQQIGLSYGMDCWFKEGLAFGYGEQLPDSALFNEVKTARGLLITAHGAKGSYTQWKNQELETISFQNTHYAPYLRYAIWRTLHSIMSRIKPFAYYVHTDGAIVNTNLLSRVEKILSEAHLLYSIKYTGLAHVKGVGNYRIGEHSSGLYHLRVKPTSNDYILSDEYDKWWLDRYIEGVELRS